MNTKFPEFNPTDACRKCQGACCKNMGCHFSPTDFKEISFDYLKEVIMKGYISIDWWEEPDDSPSYFLRMRNVGGPIIDPSWGGRCVLLTDDGCPLSFNERPLGARSLKPSPDGYCVVHYSKEQCKYDWANYSDILKELVEYFTKDLCEINKGENHVENLD